MPKRVVHRPQQTCNRVVHLIKRVCLPAPQHTPPTKAWVFLPSHGHTLPRHEASVKDRADQSRSLFVRNRNIKHPLKVPGPMAQGIKALKNQNPSAMEDLWLCALRFCGTATVPNTAAVNALLAGTSTCFCQSITTCFRCSCQARVSAASLLERVPSSGSKVKLLCFRMDDIPVSMFYTYSGLRQAFVVFTVFDVI